MRRTYVREYAYRDRDGEQWHDAVNHAPAGGGVAASWTRKYPTMPLAVGDRYRYYALDVNVLSLFEHEGRWGIGTETLHGDLGITWFDSEDTARVAWALGCIPPVL